MTSPFAVSSARLPFIIAAAAAAVLLILLICIGALTDWFNTQPEVLVDNARSLTIDPEYCEIVGTGVIRTFANSWSNLAYIGVGLVIIFLAGEPVQPRFVNHLTSGIDGLVNTTLYGVTAIVTGLLSFFFHASRIEIGKFFDVLGMYFWATFIPAYAIGKCLKSDKQQWMITPILHLCLFGLCCLFRWGLDANSEALLVGFPLAGVLIHAFLPLPLRCRHSFEGWVRLVVGVVALGVGALVRAKSMVDKDDAGNVVYSSLCEPDNSIFTPGSVVQGHAIWHSLTAVTFLFIYLYFRSEKSVA